MPAGNTSRFSDRVDNYVKYRPNYPVAVLQFLQHEFGLLPGHTVADIGSGTGISSEMFLKNGNRVLGVEPNAPMRERSLALLKEYPAFQAIEGTAERTGLPDGSIDFIVAGQAFHWFDREKAKEEFRRILSPHGVIVLIWNERLVDDAFAKAYDHLIVDHATDYVTVDHRHIDDALLAEFFAPASYTLRIFENKQIFDFEGLKGRLSSSSYVPSESQSGYVTMIADLRVLFEQYQEKNLITIHYATKAYVAKAGWFA
jgi:SAM-dependent methyltransferase